VADKHYEAVLNEIASSVNGFIAASVVDIDSGMPLATKAVREFDLDVASAYNSEMVKAKLKTMQILDLTGLEDMLLTLESQLHLIKMIGDGAFVYVAADRQSTNLALLRSAVKQASLELAA
jgi:predicted regulator of Ras-like GTPase activity (Roadblock/LC7/MglB family)